MAARPDDTAPLDEALVAARELVRVLQQLSDDPPPPPDDRRGLLRQWGTLADRLDEARVDLDRPGAT